MLTESILTTRSAEKVTIDYKVYLCLPFSKRCDLEASATSLHSRVDHHWIFMKDSKQFRLLVKTQKGSYCCSLEYKLQQSQIQ